LLVEFIKYQTECDNDEYKDDIPTHHQDSSCASRYEEWAENTKVLLLLLLYFLQEQNKTTVKNFVMQEGPLNRAGHKSANFSALNLVR
jgi:hypothetical protein